MPHADVVTIDGPNFAHRAWYASGERAYQASVTFTSMVRTAVRTHAPLFAAVAWDAPTCFRSRIYPAYKAGRVAKSEAFVEWLDSVRGLDRVAGVRCVMAPDHEADDVLATYVHQAGLFGHHCPPGHPYLTSLLFTSDHDAWALISHRTACGLLSSGTGTRYVNRATVKEQLGVDPAQVPSYKALVGCPGDNVPGVPGIGPKRAASLLGGGSSLDVALEKLRCPPVRGDLDVARAAGRLAHRLVTLNANAPVKFHLRECRVDQ